MSAAAVECVVEKLPGEIVLRPDANTSFRIRVAERLPLRGGSIANLRLGRFVSTLEHADRLALLRECRRVLECGGAVRVEGMTTGEWEPDELKVLTGLEHVAAPAHDDPTAGPTGGLELRKRRPDRTHDDPPVSILIPAYNPRFFDECLESACAQSWSRLEIVVGDDCPTDEIERIVAGRAAEDPRIRYVRHAERLGGRRNYIRLFELARGDYIKFLNDDDVLHGECVEVMARCLAAHPEVTLVTSHRRRIDAAGAALPDVPATSRPVAEDSLIEGISLANEMLNRRLNFIGEPTTAMFRREDAADLQPHLLSFAGNPSAGNGDVTLWVSLLARGDAIYITRSMSSFRQHDEQRQRDPVALERGHRGWRRLYDDASREGFVRPCAAPLMLPRPLLFRPWWPGAALESLRRCDALLAGGRTAAAGRALGRAIRHAPAEADLWVLQGKLLLAGEQIENARTAFERAVELAPQLAPALLGLATTLIHHGELEAAERMLREAACLAPGDAETRTLLTLLTVKRRPGLAEELGGCVHGCIDAPAAGVEASEYLRVTGWVLSGPNTGERPARLEIRIDGEPNRSRVARCPRPDVTAAHPRLGLVNPTPGFECVVSLEEFAPGRHELCCVLRGEDRYEVVAETGFSVVPAGATDSDVRPAPALPGASA